MADTAYRVRFEKPHRLADGEQTVEVISYDDFGSMYELELADGTTRSVGKQLVSEVEELE
ncbi:MAG: hypothetical protein ABEJ79_00480 [Halolamina sp.]